MFSRLGLLFRFVAPGPSQDQHPPPGLLSRLDKLDLPRSARPIAGKARQARRRKDRKSHAPSDAQDHLSATRAESTAAETASAASASFHSADQDRTPVSAAASAPVPGAWRSVSTASSASEERGAPTPTTAATDAPIVPSEEEPRLALGEDVEAALMFMDSQRFSVTTVRGAAPEPEPAPAPKLDSAPRGQAPDAALLLRPEGKAAVAILAALDAQKAARSTYEPIAQAIRPLAQLPPLETALRLQALAA